MSFGNLTKKNCFGKCSNNKYGKDNSTSTSTSTSTVKNNNKYGKDNSTSTSTVKNNNKYGKNKYGSLNLVNAGSNTIDRLSGNYYFPNTCGKVITPLGIELQL